MNRNRADDFSVGNRLAVWVATGLGVGCVSPAPGTVGGLWGVPLAWAITQLPHVGWQIAVISGILILSLVVCDHAVRLLVDKDPQEIVLDEIVVLPIVYLGTGIPNLRVLVAGWLFFRLFDIIKPPPARRAENLPRGWGIMADDSIAALYACATLWALTRMDQAWNWGLININQTG